MISGIGTQNSTQMPQFAKVDNPMTQEQKEAFAEIVSQYDTTNMTQEDFMSLQQELKSAGIKQGKDLRNAMEEIGLKPPPPPMGGNRGGKMHNISQSSTNELLDNFTSMLNSEMNSEDKLTNLRSLIQSNNLQFSGNLVNFSA